MNETISQYLNKRDVLGSMSHTDNSFSLFTALTSLADILVQANTYVSMLLCVI